ncbi:hypothetical protein EAS64_34450 [Trebonia kvetii]|uniref:Beta-glucuronidase C-terminal domain-containing protein n=1 Tax=Trebonia kvetii TaxID=2480626 RepID=A0A6P2BQJ8_9ACTN|nr:hypothetical protein [Trebonia kvetii]TVZ01369.1 hypothetical protein EAS64_34450 [Trebonia kvetii]
MVAEHAVQAGTSPASYNATVTVSEKAIGQIGREYIGLSFESSTINNGDRYDARGNLVALLKTLGTSVLRFGGHSADLAAFTGLKPSALSGLHRLTKASGWSAVYTENLGVFNAGLVSADARRVRAALGSKLLGFACGNEPDQYVAGGMRPFGYTIGDYLTQVGECYQAIRAGAPAAPLAGPDTTNTPAWFGPYAAREAGAIRVFGQHYYPLGCASGGDSPAAMVGTLLSPGLAAAEAARFASYTSQVKRSGAPLIMTETNSACGGGVKGLSNSYASALWVIDYLLTGAEHGVSGMNFTGGLNTLCTGYTVLCATGNYIYRPQPIYYGMLFTHLLGVGKLLRVKIAASSGGNLTAFAVRPAAGGGLRLMVENLSQQQASVAIGVGSYRGTAKVLRMTGPSLLATSGVRLQGASVTRKGGIKLGNPGTITCTAGGCPVTLAPYSAAIVTIG